MFLIQLSADAEKGRAGKTLKEEAMDKQKFLVVPMFLVAARYALENAEMRARERGVRLYASIAIVLDRKAKSVICLAEWLNGEMEPPDWEPQYDIEAIALGKLGSAIHHEENTPPTAVLEGDLEWQGGVAHAVFPVRAGVSGDDEAVDKEFATMLVSSIVSEMSASLLDM